MNAIILAAGVGSRLRPLTDTKPKTMVEVNGVPMLGRIVRALSQHEFATIAICTGYRGDAIRAYCDATFPDLPLVYVENERYESTNNMYSLYLCREFLEADCLLMNADLCFDPEIVSGLVQTEGTAFAVDVGTYIEESMKVVVADGTITSISKGVAPEAAYGCSIDVYKFDERGAGAVRSEVERVIESEGDVNQWTEVALDRLSADGRLGAKPFDIRPSRWYEIDDFDDLAGAELMFNNHWEDLRQRSVFFLDRDGTLTIEGEPLPRAAELVERLAGRGDAFFVLTNNSSKTPREHAAALQRCGLPLQLENVIVSLDAAARHLVADGLVNVHWVATEPVASHLEEVHGLRFDDEAPSAVLLTYDTTLTYEKLVRAVHHIRAGTPYFATHHDVVCPTANGPVPDIGTFIETIRLTTGRIPDMTFGKPNQVMVDGTLADLGKNYGDAVVVGDRIYTDLALKGDTNMLSVLVLTGETDRAAYEQQPVRADVVIPNLAALVDRLQCP